MEKFRLKIIKTVNSYDVMLYIYGREHFLTSCDTKETAQQVIKNFENGLMFTF